MFKYGLHNSTSLWNSDPIEINDEVQWTKISPSFFLVTNQNALTT